jgi:nucleotide-binding universal stress UspA family protein
VKVLLPSDRSAASLQAARLLADYRGERSQIEPVLLNVQRPVLKAWPGHGLDRAAVEAALHEEGMDELRAAQEILSRAGFAPELVVRLGHAPHWIVDEARERAVGVIVMGTRGHGALGGFALGSVALRVVQGAEIPVVLVKPESRLPADLGRHARIVVPVDGSDEATMVAVRLARCANVLGRLHVDVVHFQQPLTVMKAIVPPHRDALSNWSGREAGEAVARAREALAAGGVEHEIHLLAGDPATGIAQFAKDHSADLIAMSTRGLGALHHAFIGSVALKTAHLSPVPVALMR